MKVKCIKIYNESKNEFLTQSKSLTIGKIYIVLEMLIYQDKKILYRLARDSDETPALFNAVQFNIASHDIRPNWGIYSLSNDAMIFTPKAWIDPGFWEKYFDGEHEVLEIFNREVSKIIHEEI